MYRCVSQRTILHLCACALVLSFAVGCEDSRKLTSAEQIRTLRRENRQLQNQLQEAESQNQQLKKQVQVLSGLPEDKFDSLYDLKKIRLTRYTNFYDKDKDGKKEKLIVYLQPVDSEDNKVKAGGTVDVQLWDLSKESDKSLLAEWHVKPDELKKFWFDTFLTTNYRLAFDVNDIVKNFDKPFTVKVTFNDYLSGKVFEEQKIIKP